MTAQEAIGKYEIGTKLYVFSEVDIRWESIRFYNTGLEPSVYIIDWYNEPNFYSSSLQLIRIYAPDGAKRMHKNFSVDEKYHCFLTREEAEAWKIVELNGLEERIESHLETLKIKTKKKLSSIKKKIKFDEYVEKFPSEVLKVI